MTQRIRSKALQLLAAVLITPAALFLASSAFGADELAEANKLVKAGQYAPAMEHVDTFLAANPRDAQGRFLKGIILTEQGKTADATTVFQKLTEDYPELPEPYNNLAVLYAQQGQYEKAKTELEMAIRTHPSYGTAHENLGDVYAKLASQAYSKALQLDGSNTTAQSKLALIRDLITVNMRNPKAVAVAKADTKKVASAEPVKPAVTPPAGKTEPAIKEPAAKTAVEPAKPVTSAVVTPPPAKPAVANDNEEIIKTLKAWAAAWSSKDVPAYLGFYARDFKTPGNQPRAEWENARKIRIQAPKSISVAIDSIKIRMSGTSTALVTFHQNYKSDTLKQMGATKTVAMSKSDGKWKILEERVGG